MPTLGGRAHFAAIVVVSVICCGMLYSRAQQPLPHTTGEFLQSLSFAQTCFLHHTTKRNTVYSLADTQVKELFKLIPPDTYITENDLNGIPGDYLGTLSSPKPRHFQITFYGSGARITQGRRQYTLYYSPAVGAEIQAVFDRVVNPVTTTTTIGR